MTQARSAVVEQGEDVAHGPSAARAASAGAMVLALGVAGVEGTAAALRALMYGGVLVAAGLTAFHFVVGDGAATVAEGQRLRRGVQLAAGAGAIATVAGLLVQIAVVSGRGWPGLVDPDAAEVVARSTAVLAATQRLVGLVLLVYAAERRSTDATAPANLLGAVGALVTLTSFVAVGHAATRTPRALAWLIDLTHTASAALWVGGLVGLTIVVQRDRSRRAVAVARFARVASATTALLVASGLGLAWAELEPAGGVPFTSYGFALVGKAAAVVAAVAIGAVNHFLVVPATASGDPRSATMLRQTLTAELALLTAAVVLTGILVGLDP